MKKLLIVFMATTILPLIAIAEQSQPQKEVSPKNYEALIAEDGRSRCESSLAAILRQMDELRAKNQKLEAQLAELQKTKDTAKEEK